MDAGIQSTQQSIVYPAIHVHDLLHGLEQLERIGRSSEDLRGTKQGMLGVASPKEATGG